MPSSRLDSLLTPSAHEASHRERAEGPEGLRRRARVLLKECFGADGPEDVAVGGACGAAGLLSEHTHYSDGFGVLMPLPQGAAVAVRAVPKAPSRLTLAGEEAAAWTVEEAAAEDEPPEVRVAAAAVRTFAPGPVEAAVVSTVPPTCADAALSACAVAAARALRRLPDTRATGEEKEEAGVQALLEEVRQVLAETSGRPFSIACPLASAAAARPPDFTLVDTATGEHLPVETPPEDALGRALVMLPTLDLDRPAAFHHERRRQAHEALTKLRSGGFSGLSAFRDLEHRDLDGALELLPPALQPVARHLSTENRRVPKLVAAARRGDAQLLGALLLMSHASLRDDWQSTAPPLDLIAETVEAGTLGGVHGARMTGRGACALLLGRPDALPDALDRLTNLLAERFDLHAETMLL